MRRVAGFLTAWVLVYSGACASDGEGAKLAPPGGVDGSAADGARVVFDPHLAGDPYEPLPGGPTDEALSAVLSARPIQGSVKAAALIAPPSASTIERGSAPVFAWRAAQASVAPRSRARPHPAGGVIAPWPLGRVRQAHAHNPPYSGTVYLLQISSPKTRGLRRLFTAATSFTPEPSLWEAMLADGGPFTVELRTARLTDNRVDADGGPFDAPAVTFTLGP